MILDILSPTLHAPQPLGPVLDQQLLDQVLGFFIHMSLPLNLPCQNLLINHKMILIKERRISSKHLVDEDAECPPVHGLVVTLGLDDLRCQVLWCAAQGPRSVRNFLGESKVSSSEVRKKLSSANLVEQEI